jgi:hypothetical protein
MAQGSIPWDEGSGGDAGAGSAVWDSPYSSAEWRDMYSKLFGSNRADGMVIPGYGNNMEVYESTPQAMAVEVATGAMFIRGGIYENNAVATLTIAASDPVNPRLDRVVARITVASQAIRVAVVTGVAGAAPALPALTQGAAIWEVDLAHVYVQGNILVITDEDIDDKRIFFDNGLQNTNLLGSNLLVNSEYFAYPALSAADPTTVPPDYWQLVVTPSAMTRTTALSQQVRGECVQITSDAANEGIEQTVHVKPSTTYAIKGCYNVTAGDVGKVNVTTDSAAPVTLTRELRRVGADLEFTCYYTTENDASELTLQLLNLNSGDVVKWGQFIIVEGYDAGPFREIRETLMFEWDVHTDAAWNATAKGVAVHNIDFDVNFGGYVLPGARSVYMTWRCTAAGNCVTYVQSVTTNAIFHTHDWGLSARQQDSFVAIALDSNRQIEINVTLGATSGSTLRIVGIEV